VAHGEPSLARGIVQATCVSRLPQPGI
jgi:hypothetical protein